MILCFLEYNSWLILDLWNNTKRPENPEQSEKLYWNTQIKCEKCLEIFFTYSKLYKDLYELCNVEVGLIHFFCKMPSRKNVMTWSNLLIYFTGFNSLVFCRNDSFSEICKNVLLKVWSGANYHRSHKILFFMTGVSLARVQSIATSQRCTLWTFPDKND